MKTIFTTLAQRRYIIPAVILGLLTALAFTLTQKTQAPEVTFTTLEGKTISMAELEGKVVLVNFWATDCPGCIAEMPGLIKTYNEYKPQGFEVIAVAMEYDPPSQVLTYTQKNALPFPVMHDSYGEMSKKFGNVQLTPTAFILDKQGNIVRKVIGELNFKDLHQLLDEKLASKQGTQS
jgi:peroxiredoxin